MQLKIAEKIRDSGYEIRDGVYIGKYTLAQAKTKLAQLIQNLFEISGDPTAHQIANQLQNKCLPLSKQKSSDRNDEIFWRSLSEPLYQLDMWVPKYLNNHIA